MAILEDPTGGDLGCKGVGQLEEHRQSDYHL